VFEAWAVVNVTASAVPDGTVISRKLGAGGAGAGGAGVSAATPGAGADGAGAVPVSSAGREGVVEGRRAAGGAATAEVEGAGDAVGAGAAGATAEGSAAAGGAPAGAVAVAAGDAAGGDEGAEQPASTTNQAAINRRRMIPPLDRTGRQYPPGSGDAHRAVGEGTRGRRWPATRSAGSS